MDHRIETTLAILKDVMTAHKATLTRAPSGPRPPVPEEAVEPRARLALRLMTRIEAYYGLDINKTSAEKLLRVLDPTDLTDLQLYVERLEQAGGEHPDWLSLVEKLTVHETYVMRDPDQLNFFCGLLPALIEEAARKRAYTLRFWSVGCASGEEAYTIAALVLRVLLATGNAFENGEGITLRAPWHIQVLGSDISRRALAQANAARYETGPLSSFRTEWPELLRLFPAAPGSANPIAPQARVAHSCLRSIVRFEQFNILSDPLPGNPFQAVFCRNMLVYFSLRARRVAHERLARAIDPGGYLVLGPTDTIAPAAEFDTLWAPGAVIHRRRGDHA